MRERVSLNEKPNMSKRSEHTEQVALFNWCKLMEQRHLQLALIFSIPNGGKRHLGTAIKLKASGTKSGIPDIFLPVANRHGKHGLWIELKVGKNKPTKNQLWWIHSLRAEGYAVEVCYGFEESQAAIINYLELEVR